MKWLNHWEEFKSLKWGLNYYSDPSNGSLLVVVLKIPLPYKKFTHWINFENLDLRKGMLIGAMTLYFRIRSNYKCWNKEETKFKWYQRLVFHINFYWSVLYYLVVLFRKEIDDMYHLRESWGNNKTFVNFLIKKGGQNEIIV